MSLEQSCQSQECDRFLMKYCCVQELGQFSLIAHICQVIKVLPLLRLPQPNPLKDRNAFETSVFFYQFKRRSSAGNVLSEELLLMELKMEHALPAKGRFKRDTCVMETVTVPHFQKAL